jgi:Chaperone of endosialidase
MNPSIRVKKAALLFVVPLVCFGLLPKAQAVNPPPDGGYPGGNTAEGQNALFNLTTGTYNTAVGWLSLESLSTGSFNTATGAGSLLFNAADNNTAFGATALLFNTEGSFNTAVGAIALLNNTEGSFNTAVGYGTLYQNRTGGDNTAVGDNALFFNITGEDNTAVGGTGLFSNQSGSNNTAVGRSALVSNQSGSLNTAVGRDALSGNTTGDENTAIGQQALDLNTSGSENVAVGPLAGHNVTTANNVIAIGLPGENVSDRCYIGNIRGRPVGNGDGINVIVDSSGQLGTSNSSRRFKKNIKPMDQASQAILALKPVTFHYKNSDTKRPLPQFGLIAEEVAEVNPDLVVRDADGELLSVRYDAVNAMLLNEFLKEHRKNEEQEAVIAQLKQDFQSKLAEQQKQIEALTAGLQKVSAQLAAASPSPGGLEASKFAIGRIRGGGPAPQVVNNP